MSTNKLMVNTLDRESSILVCSAGLKCESSILVCSAGLKCETSVLVRLAGAVDIVNWGDVKFVSLGI